MTNEFGDTPVVDEADEAIKIIEESGDEVQALKMKLARAERKANAFKARADASEAVGYKAELLKEYPNADLESITGKTKAEMKQSAATLHAAVERVIAARGLTVPGTAPKPSEDPRKAEWGTPPPVATEVVQEAPIDFAAITRAATTGLGPDGKPMDRKAVIRANMDAPRQMERRTIAGVLSGRQAAQ